MVMCGEVSVCDNPKSPATLNADGRTGHCFLMMEDLQQAYSAYQQALYHLKDPKVSSALGPRKRWLTRISLGTQAVVRNWDSV